MFISRLYKLNYNVLVVNGGETFSIREKCSSSRFCENRVTIVVTFYTFHSLVLVKDEIFNHSWQISRLHSNLMKKLAINLVPHVTSFTDNLYIKTTPSSS